MCPSTNLSSSTQRTDCRTENRSASEPQDDKTNARAMTATGSSSLDIKECSPSALAECLTHQRFSGDVAKSLEFLQQVIEALPAKTGELATEGVPRKANEASSTDFGNPLLQSPLETSLLNPRGGKCSIQLYDKGFFVATLLKDPSVQLVLPASAVSHSILFAKAEDYKLLQTSHPKKQPNAHLVLLKLHDSANVEFQNKVIQGHICFALSWVKGVGPTGPETTTTNEKPQIQIGWSQATQAWRKVLETCLGGPNNPTLKMVQVQHQPSASAPFFSCQTPGQSTTTGGMPFVKCYQGVHDGVLYPLREGLLFYKPPRFLPRSELVSIACGRGSGGGGGGGQSSGSRYVDMVVQKHHNGETVEFTNIQREELGVLNEYIHQVLIPALEADANEGNSKGLPMESRETNADGSESSEDEDNSEVEDDTDDEDESFVDEIENQEEGEADDDDHDRDSEDNDDYDDDDDEDDGFEVVEDEFAKELTHSARAGKLVHDEPRASRSSKRKELPPIAQPVEEFKSDDIVTEMDDDFEVVQANSSTESEGEDDDGSASGSPPKKSRY